MTCRRCLIPVLPNQQPPLDANIFYAQFSPYAGIDPESTFDGFPAMDVATFLGPNSGYYLARFHFMIYSTPIPPGTGLLRCFRPNGFCTAKCTSTLWWFFCCSFCCFCPFWRKLLIRAESVDGLWKYSRYLSGASFAGERTRLCSPLADGLHESCGIPGFRVAGCYGYLVKPFLS